MVCFWFGFFFNPILLVFLSEKNSKCCIVVEITFCLFMPKVTTPLPALPEFHLLGLVMAAASLSPHPPKKVPVTSAGTLVVPVAHPEPRSA